MRIIMFESATDLSGLRARLLRPGLAADAVRQAEARLRAVNPHLKFDHIAAGTVVVVPVGDEFQSDGGGNPAGPVQDEAIRRSAEGLAALASRMQAAGRESAAQRDVLAKTLKSRPVQQAMHGDATVRRDVLAVERQVAAEDKEAQDQAALIAKALKVAAADLEALRLRLAGKG